MTFLRNCWYVAAGAEEVTGTPLARTFLGTNVVMYRGADGAPVALDNICPHRFAPLDRGVVSGDTIQCPYHGLRFDAAGHCVSVPGDGEAGPRATPRASPRARLRAYPIVQRYQLLWIWMGDAALADAASIPDFSYLEDPEFGWFNGYLYVNANYQLAVDNLLDLTHTEFLHPMLTSKGWTGRNVQTVTQKNDTVHVSNIAYNDPINPLLRQLRPDMETFGTLDQDLRWDAPGLLRLYFEFQAGGEKLVIPSGHFLTPETEMTTHYILRGGHQEIHNPEYSAANKAAVLHIFSTEDVPMIEAQQRYLGGKSFMESDPVILKSDAPAIRARRLLAKKIRLEQDASQRAVA